MDKIALSFTETVAGITFTWQTQAQASGYDLQVFQGTTLVLSRENQPEPIVLTPADGLAEDTDYTAQVRAWAGNAFSTWSSAVPFRLASVSSVLLALQQRLQDHRPTANAIALNALTLPAGLPGSPALVLTVIHNSLKTDDLVITVSTQPTLSADKSQLTLSADKSQLTLVGTATILNASNTTVHLVFGVSDTRLLSLTLQADLPQDWGFAQSFPHQNLGSMDLWDSTQPRFFLTSYPHTETAVFYPLAAGLNFLGTLHVANDLVPSSTEGAVIQTLDFGGLIDNLNTSVAFHFQGQHTLNDLTLKPLGWPPLTLKNGTLLLDSIPSPQADAGNTNSFRIRGTISFSYGDLPFELAVPTKVPQPLSAVMADGGNANFATIQALVSALLGDTLGQYLPTSLQNLSGIHINSFSFYFDPAQASPTLSTVEVGSSDWNLSLFDLVNPKLSLNSFISLDALGRQMRTDQLIVSATLAIGTGAAFDVSLVVPYQGDWVLQVKNTQPTMQNLASFLGSTSAQLIAALPSPIQGMGTLVPTELRIGFNPFAPSWSFVAFTIQQVEKWTIVHNVMEVDNWHIAMELAWQNGSWQADSLLEGDIQLAGHPVHMTLPIPLGEQGWTLNFAQDPITIPSFNDLLTLIGAQQASNLLPQGVRDLGSLTITQLQINFDPSNTASPIRAILFQINTPSPWTLIPNADLIINSLRAGIKVSLAGEGFVTTGFIRGLLTVMGTPVYVGTQRSQPDEPWLLVLQTVRMIHIPGLAELAAWMLPQEMLAYIPVNFMPFSQGLDLTDFDLEFDLTNSTLNRLQVQIQNSESWQIIAGYLSLDSVFVKATIANPLSTTPSPTVLIEGTLLLGNLEMTLSATRAVSTEPWVFSGDLALDETVNLSQLIKSLLSEELAVPDEMPDLEFSNVSVSITPGTGEFTLTGACTALWDLPFGVSGLAVSKVDLTLHRGPTTGSGDQSQQGQITCSLALHSEGPLTIVDGLVFKSLDFTFDLVEQASWSLSGAVAARIFDVDATLSVSLNQTSAARTITLAATDSATTPLVDLGGIGSLSGRDLTITISKALQPTANATENGVSLQTSSPYTWAISVTGDLKMEHVFELAGTLQLSKQISSVGLVFKPTSAQVAIPMPEPLAGVQFYLALEYLAISGTTDVQGKRSWAFDTDVAVWLSGLMPRVQAIAPSAAKPVTGHFKADSQEVLLAIDHVIPRVDFPVPTARVGSRTLDLGTAAVEVSDLQLRLGSSITLSTDFAIGIPQELNKLFGSKDDGSPVVQFFNTYQQGKDDTVTKFKLGLDSSNGLQVQVATSPVKAITFVTEGQDTWCYADMGEFGAVKFMVPVFSYVGEGFSGRGSFTQTKELKIPLTPLKLLLQACHLDAVANKVPPGLPLRACKIYDATTNQFDIDTFIQTLEDVGNFTLDDDIKNTLRTIEGQLDKLPTASNITWTSRYPSSSVSI